MSKLLPERYVVVILFGLLLAFSLWLQFVILEDQVQVTEDVDDDSPDVYIEKFTAVGMDDQGNRRYVLEADRAVHYPKDGSAVLDFPHVIQFNSGSAPVHTYADSGWLVGPHGEEVILTGNVRVIQGYDPDSGGGGVQRSKRMRVRLKEKIGS